MARSGTGNGKPAPTASSSFSFVTPVVKDEEGRRLTRTMKSTDKLQDLMRFKYAMLHPAVEDAKGVFLHRSRWLHYDQTLADYSMKDGDEIQFLPEISPSMFVTPMLCDEEGRMFTCTMRRINKMQSSMEYCCAMVTLPYGWSTAGG